MGSSRSLCVMPCARLPLTCSALMHRSSEVAWSLCFQSVLLGINGHFPSLSSIQRAPKLLDAYTRDPAWLWAGTMTGTAPILVRVEVVSP